MYIKYKDVPLYDFDETIFESYFSFVLVSRLFGVRYAIPVHNLKFKFMMNLLHLCC